VKYKVIIFDLGGVTLKFDHHISADKIALRFGLDRDYVYNLFFDSKLTNLFDEGNIAPHEFYMKAKKLLDIDISLKELKDCYNDIFSPMPGIEKIIKNLKRRYKVYLMSNTNKSHFDFIRKKFGIIKEFDKLILSYKVGARKPDPIIYRYALKLAGTTPDKVIFIDDRPELIKGARAVGITGIVFKDLSGLKKALKKTLFDKNFS